MAKKNQEGSSRKASPVHVKKASSPINIQNGGLHRTSPSCSNNRLSPSLSNSDGSSLGSSPGLLAGHFAGCKWSETPSPSALPKPPLHWMPTTTSSHHGGFFRETSDDVSYQLKLLLKVQA